MKVFITGGAGNIGSTIADLLLARGDQVLVLDDFSTGKKHHIQDHENLTFVEGSIVDAELLNKLMTDFQPEAVVHCAASYKDPDDWVTDTMVNSVGGVNVIQACQKHNVKRTIYFQTALCYGIHPTEHPITLNHPINPDNSSYAITKTSVEEVLRLSGIDYVTFRLANVIGPRTVSGPLPIFYQRLKEGKQCFATKARRDFIYTPDLAKLVVRAVDGEGNGIYHFSSGSDWAIKDFYDLVAGAMKLDPIPAPEIKELGADDAASILLDPSRTFADFGEIEFTPMEQAIHDIVAYYDKHGVHGGYTHLKINKED
ncbi:nucleotide sugar epimerase [Terasakiella brassicae]|uniref:Nucleotide sugar epimerase n=1 Tax=Terasakiella brassicae TaxID=1634917 RepID=A0A917C3R2_9PROT|nr:NAD-dependent epimerase/dehydratase family protein [Terasakiella brassicae]GGF66676.1 nucleotide sugar epimerase [Terasakiella brassicae]